MANRITFARVQQYLDAIADKAILDIGSSSHQRFWGVTYHQFINGVVPGGTDVECKGQATLIINKNDPLQTPFFLILTQQQWCNINQMPEGGPFVTDADYTV